MGETRAGDSDSRFKIQDSRSGRQGRDSRFNIQDSRNRSQEPGARSQESGVRSQESGVRLFRCGFSSSRGADGHEQRPGLGWRKVARGRPRHKEIGVAGICGCHTDRRASVAALQQSCQRLERPRRQIRGARLTASRSTSQKPLHIPRGLHQETRRI